MKCPRCGWKAVLIHWSDGMRWMCGYPLCGFKWKPEVETTSATAALIDN